jgi:ParB family chromosome partitioning protein
MSKKLVATPESGQETVLTALDAPFDLELLAGSIKGAMKAGGASSKDLWIVPVAAIRIMPGFQPKIKNKSYIATVEKYAESMVEIDWLEGSTLKGYAAVVDGEAEPVIYVTDGHTRLLSLEIANKERARRGMAPISSVPIIVSNKGVSMDDLNVGLIRGNDSRALAPYEVGVVCKRLLGSGHSEADVQRMTGVKDPWFTRLMLLMAAPMKLRKLVAFEAITATFAIETIEDYGPKALAMIEEAQAKLLDKEQAKAGVSAASDDGSSTKDVSEVKVSARHLAKTPAQEAAKAIKKMAPSMHTALRLVHDDPGFARLSPVNRERIAALMKELPDVTEAKLDGVPAVNPNQQPLFASGEPSSTK